MVRGSLQTYIFLFAYSSICLACFVAVDDQDPRENESAQFSRGTISMDTDAPAEHTNNMGLQQPQHRQQQQQQQAIPETELEDEAEVESINAQPQVRA